MPLALQIAVTKRARVRLQEGRALAYQIGFDIVLDLHTCKNGCRKEQAATQMVLPMSMLKTGTTISITVLSSQFRETDEVIASR